MNNAGISSKNPAPNPARLPEIAERTVLDWARDAGEADRLIKDLEVCLRRRRRRRGNVVAASLVIGVLLAVAGPLWRMKVESPANSVANVAVLRPETRTLSDGSIVELRAGAAIEVDFAGPVRRVTLRKGEAHFQVAKDPRWPFVVAAAGVEVRAVGTAFSVELGASAIEVVVTEGTIALEKPEQPRAPLTDAAAPVDGPKSTFGAGKRIVVELAPEDAAGAAPQVSTLSPSEVGEHLAWRVPRLEFSGTPLSQALTMFNQHSRLRLMLADPALGRLQLSGVLRADDSESLLRLLEGEFALTPERRGDELVLRRQL